MGATSTDSSKTSQLRPRHHNVAKSLLTLFMKKSERISRISAFVIPSVLLAKLKKPPHFRVTVPNNHWWSDFNRKKLPLLREFLYYLVKKDSICSTAHIIKLYVHRLNENNHPSIWILPQPGFQKCKSYSFTTARPFHGDSDFASTEAPDYGSWDQRKLVTISIRRL